MIRAAMLALCGALVCAAVIVGAPRSYAQEEPLAVEGRVVNGTPDGGPVEGLVVTLHRHTGERIDDLTTQAGPGGEFRFEDFTYNPETAYGVSVDYEGALYGTDLDLSAGSPGPIELTVYDATDDEAVIGAPVVSMLIAEVDPDTQTLWGMEITTISNTAERTYVPGPEPMQLLRFGLPEGAQGLQVDTNLIGAEAIQVDRGFGLSASVPPGEHEVMFSYRFPYADDTLGLSKSFPYGADRFRVLVPTEGMELSGEEFGQPEVAQVGDSRYLLFQSADVGRGERIAFELRDLPRAGLADRMSNSIAGVRMELAAPAALAVLMAALVAFAVYRRRRAQRAAPGARGGGEAAALVRLIAELDAGHRAGTISDDDYARRYTALRARLDTVREDGQGA